MPETLLLPPVPSGDQYTQPQEAPQADVVFDGVYGTFAREAHKKDQKNGAEFGKAFVADRFEKAKESLEPLDRPAPISEIKQNFMQQIATEADRQYQKSPSGRAMRMERGERLVEKFLNRAGSMIKAGETDGLTVKMFLDRIKGIPYTLSFGYNDLTKKVDEEMPEKPATNRYFARLNQLVAGKTNWEQQSESTYVIFNSRNPRFQETDTTGRYYISWKLNGQPEVVLETWMTILSDMGLDEEICFKTSEGIARTYDSIVVYTNRDTAEPAQQAIEEFIRRCPPELLSETNMPSGAPIAKGVSRAPEPSEVLKLQRYTGEKSFSYNQFICALTELSLRRASYDYIKQGIRPEDVTPRMLAQAGKVYFTQLIKLSGIDPSTMEVAGDQ